MTDFNQRLKQAITIRNISQTELCSRTGIPKSAMSQYLSGAFKPKQKRTYLLAKALNVNEAWLMGYEDVPMERNEQIESNISETIPQDKIHLVPVFESVSAGFGAYACSDIVDYIPLFINNPADVPDTICIKVKGDSMYPTIENGDIVVVRKQASVDSGQIAVVLIDKEEGLVKRIVYDNDSIELQSINPEYQSKIFKDEDTLRVDIVGLVQQVIKCL